MAWSTPRTWVAGEVVTAAIGNTHWRDNLAYLHGDAGPVTLAAALSTPGLTSTVGLTVSGGAATGNLRDNETNTMRVQKHPYGTARHMESGNVSNTATSYSVSFTTAYSSAPNVVFSTAGTSKITAITTSNFTVSNPAAESTNFYWIAEGAN